MTSPCAGAGSALDIDADSPISTTFTEYEANIEIKFKSAATLEGEYIAECKADSKLCIGEDFASGLKAYKINYITELFNYDLIEHIRPPKKSTPVYHILAQQIKDFIGNTMDAAGDTIIIRLTSSEPGMKKLEKFAKHTHMVEVTDNGSGFSTKDVPELLAKREGRHVVDTKYTSEFKRKLTHKSTNETGGQRKGLEQIRTYLDCFCPRPPLDSDSPSKLRKSRTQLRVGNVYDGEKIKGGLVSFWLPSIRLDEAITANEYTRIAQGGDRSMITESDCPFYGEGKVDSCFDDAPIRVKSRLPKGDYSSLPTEESPDGVTQIGSLPFGNHARSSGGLAARKGLSLTLTLGSSSSVDSATPPSSADSSSSHDGWF